MKFAVSIKTPEAQGEAPLALFTGTFDERLQKAAAQGYKGVELIVSDPSKLDAKDLNDRMAAYGLVPVAVATGYIFGSRGLTLVNGDPSVHQRAAELLKELVQFASELGCNLVTIGGFRGKAAFVGGMEQAREQLHNALSGAEPLALELGVRIALEPLRRVENDLLNNAQEVCDFIQEGGHKAVYLLLDVYHTVEEPDRLDVYRLYRDQLVHVHLADTGRVALGLGDEDFTALEKVLEEIGYEGWQSVELPRADDPDGNGRLPAYLLSL